MQFKEPLKFYIWILFLACLSFAVLISLDGYERSFIRLNSFRSKGFDKPMQIISWLGNGGTAGLICWLFLRKKSVEIQWTGFLILSVSGIVTQLLKIFIFPDWHRPIFIFEGQESVHYFPGQDFKFNSFPSGHSTTAAAMGFILARFAVSKVYWAIGPALLTLLIGYSRVYNGLHFPGDVLAGWILGFSTSLALVYWLKGKSIPYASRFSPYFPKILAVIVVILFIFDLVRFPWHLWA
jgi:undecaprenyl-diphosphatase